MKLLLLVLLANLTYHCFGQQDNRIQLGQVIGKPIKEFRVGRGDYENRIDSALKLEDITKSKYLIEIRVYEDPSLFPTKACTVLYYDTAFHLTRFLSLNASWEEKYKVEATVPLSKINPKTIFNQLTELGIFSLNTMDGTGYRFVTKVGDIFNETFVRNSAQLLCDPSDQMLQRKLKIKDLLQAMPEQN